MDSLTLSSNQVDVIDKLGEYNVLVDSVAGSGKTTTILHIAKRYPEFKFLLLTYNKKLKFETRQRVENDGLTNVETHSYHSFCVKYYLRTCFTDSGIIKIVKGDIACLKKFGYDYIVLDESQDLTPLYFSLICKLYYDSTFDYAKFCVLGDKNQSIYAFNKADERFIVFADRIFNINKFEWKRVKLDTSFRITKPMALFVNNCLLGYENLKSIKNGSKVRYLICNSFCSKYGGKVYDEFKMYIRMGYDYSDIFILAPSVRSDRSPPRKLANYMSSKGIPIYVPNNDEQKLDEDVLKNKVGFSTFHQVKGLERKVVIVFGFDASYFEFYKKDSDQLICPNEIYVATTRAKEQLTVIHHKGNDFMPFIDRSNLPNIVDINGYMGEMKSSKSFSSKPKAVSVTDVTKYLPVEVVETAVGFLTINQVQNRDKMIEISVKSKQGDLYENVSEITGVAIPSYFALIKTGEMYTQQSVVNTNISTSELLKLSNKFCAGKTGYNYKLTQIKNYDWLEQCDLDSCVTRLEKHISKNSIFEKEYVHYNFDELIGMDLTGYIDCIDVITDGTINVWEFKCVSKIEDEHYIQLALYAYLYYKNKPSHKDRDVKFYVFNILDNSIFKLEIDHVNLSAMVKYLFNYKYGDRKVISDKEFFANCENSVKIASNMG
jgi:hypothetical protein